MKVRFLIIFIELLIFTQIFGQNQEKNLDKHLIAILDTIYKKDQKYRLELDSIYEKYGWGSEESEAQWKIINEKDSTNLIVVKDILNNKGWLGKDIIGSKGNTTLFLVIQHSNLKTQEYYLPMMRDAVKKGNAKGNELALLEDRTALGQGKKQIYGSQVQELDGKWYVQPLEDPKNVDKRRAEVGLGLIKDYVALWKMTWDVDEYIKMLPEYEVKLKKRMEEVKKRKK